MAINDADIYRRLGDIHGTLKSILSELKEQNKTQKVTELKIGEFQPHKKRRSITELPVYLNNLLFKGRNG